MRQDKPIALGARSWMRAELQPWIGEGTDRAGNGFPYLTVALLPGTELDSEYERDAEGHIRGRLVTLLDQPVQIVIRLSPAALVGLAIRAHQSKRGQSKVGPLLAHRTVKVTKTKTERRPL